MLSPFLFIDRINLATISLIQLFLGSHLNAALIAKFSENCWQRDSHAALQAEWRPSLGLEIPDPQRTRKAWRHAPLYARTRTHAHVCADMQL